MTRRDSGLVPRRVAELADEFLDDFRVLIINGPRQSGKTALLRQLNSTYGGTYVSLDDGDLRRGQFILADSTRFLSNPSLHESLAGRAGVVEV